MSYRPLTPEQPKSRALVCRVRVLSLDVVLKFSPGGRIGALLVGQTQQVVGAGVVKGEAGCSGASSGSLDAWHLHCD